MCIEFLSKDLGDSSSVRPGSVSRGAKRLKQV